MSTLLPLTVQWKEPGEMHSLVLKLDPTNIWHFFAFSKCHEKYMDHQRSEIRYVFQTLSWKPSEEYYKRIPVWSETLYTSLYFWMISLKNIASTFNNSTIDKITPSSLWNESISFFSCSKQSTVKSLFTPSKHLTVARSGFRVNVYCAVWTNWSLWCLWLLMKNLKVNWEKMLLPPPVAAPAAASPALFAPYGAWHGTQQREEGGGQKLQCGRRKSLVFCPSWNLIQKFRILEDKKHTEGGGKEGKDGRSFSLFSHCDKSKLSKYAATSDQSKSSNMFLIERRRPLREITRTHLGLWSPVSVNCRNCCWMATGAKVSQWPLCLLRTDLPRVRARAGLIWFVYRQMRYFLQPPCHSPNIKPPSLCGRLVAMHFFKKKKEFSEHSGKGNYSGRAVKAHCTPTQITTWIYFPSSPAKPTEP